ncbi:MAG TPA: MFS transporter, partial [Acetobacteraceae bacterium]
MRPRTGLAAINFFLADVAGGLGPFLATWLAGAAHWSPERVGIVLTVIGLAGIAFAGPAGALVDALGCPRLLLALGTLIVAIGTLALLPARHLAPVLVSQIAVAAAAALIAPALTALTLGIVGKETFPAQQGRNQAWNHAGNVVASVLIAWLAGTIAGISAFWVFSGMALASGIALLTIRRSDVDIDRARGRTAGAPHVTLTSVLTDRRVLLVCVGLMMFHLSNAAMLPLLGQRMADVGHGNATRWLAICVIVAQLTMVGVAAATAWASMRIARSWLFLIPCLVLPVRGAMAAFAWAPEWLLPIQVLDACGAGLLGVSLPILIADYTWGSGHTQTALGVANMFQGVGAALSTTVGGVL